MKILQVTDDYNNFRLDRFLRKKIHILSQGFIERLIRTKQIRVNGQRTKACQHVHNGDIVEVKVKIEDIVSTKCRKIISKEVLHKIRQSILHESKDIIVLNKPHAIATQGGMKVAYSIDEYIRVIMPTFEPKLVHRLDKDTSGLLIIAKNAQTARELSHIIKTRQITKKYICIVKGKLSKLQGEIKVRLSKNYKVDIVESEGVLSITKFKVLQASTDVSLLEVELVTGRKHQIRSVMNYIGHPIIGDGKYGGKKAFIEGISNKLHLHAFSILIDNFRNKQLFFKAPLPEHMLASLTKLGFNHPFS